MRYLFLLSLLALLNTGIVSANRNKGISPGEKIAIQEATRALHPQAPLKSDLPLVILPSGRINNQPLIFFISGDGGWSEFDQGVSKYLFENGISIIGLDSRRYFMKEKVPNEVANEIARVVEYYCQLWNCNSFVLLGYSFGACVVPFIADNFSVKLKSQLKGVYCLSPNVTGDFRIHIMDLLNMGTTEKYNVLEEMKKIKDLNPICIFGDGEDSQEREYFKEAGITVQLLPGEHHYKNNYKAVAEMIYNNLSAR